MKDYTLSVVGIFHNNVVTDLKTNSVINQELEELFAYKPVIMDYDYFLNVNAFMLAKSKVILVGNKGRSIPRTTTTSCVKNAIGLARRNNYINLKNPRNDIIALCTRNLFDDLTVNADYLCFYLMSSNIECIKQSLCLSDAVWTLIQQGEFKAVNSEPAYTYVKFRRNYTVRG